VCRPEDDQSVKEGVKMSTIVTVIVMWVLLQLLVVWFCGRVGAARELDAKKAYRELQESLAREELNAYIHERLTGSSPDAPTQPRVAPAGVARA
jgi:hypothetical protein